jgi:lycopene beta-cyclase
MSAASRPGLSRKLAASRPRGSGPRTTYPYAILGAGCAGLSLAWNLVELGVREPILLIDRRERFENDRTWCFWDVEPTPFSGLASHAWSRWGVHDGRREVVVGCPEYHYLRLRAADFYREVLGRLAEAPNVTLALGRPIVGVRETRKGVVIATADREFVGRRVFDSSGQAAEARSPVGGVGLLQHFFGQTVCVDRPVFDPSRATLMDFRVSQADGPHFLYVLPLSEREALVENTYLFPFAAGVDRHRLEIAEYLRARHGLRPGDYHVTEEVGRRPSPTGSRVEPIGLVGGAARPSSGYAFLRIQRQTRGLALAIAAGLDPPATPLASRKYDLLDAIFLRVLADRPDLAPDVFGRMFDRADPASVVRFLGERSTAVDDARIIAALPKMPFVAAAIRSAISACRRP